MDIRDDDEAAPAASRFALSASMVHQPELRTGSTGSTARMRAGRGRSTIRDDATGDGGTLNAWSLTICEPPPPPACAPGFTPQTVFSTDFEAGAAGFTHSGTADEWERPAHGRHHHANPSPITTCNSGTNCWKTDLDNTYDISSTRICCRPASTWQGSQRRWL